MRHIVSSLLSVAAVAIVLLGSLSSTQAAVVYSFGQITGEASIIDNGDVLLTFGGTGTINGIPFSQSSNADGVTRSFSGFGTCGGDFSTQFSGGLNSILSGCHFQPGSGSPTITFNGLNVGEVYSLQMLWSNNLPGNRTGEQSRLSIQGQAFTYNIPFDSNNAYYLLAEFTAGSTSEVVTLGRGSSFEPYRFQMNGFVFSGTPDTVPAPGAMMLLGFGLLGLGVRRRII